MILARCPHCETIFRAKPEALKARTGKVRCGKCRKAFNALEHLVEEFPDTPDKPLPVGGFELVPPPTATAPSAKEATAGDDVPPVAPDAPETATEAHIDPAAVEPVPADPLLDAPAAVQVAARDTRDLPGYSKWAEGTFATAAPGFDETHRPNWMAILLAVVLALAAVVQILYLFRTDIASKWPATRPWLEEACLNLGCTVPYPADPDLIDIQASELQIDPERGGLLVLHLTMQNRAEVAQAYPSVELTLTDLREQVVARKRLAPSEWLPVRLESPKAFPPRGEIAARLWIDPQDTGAFGYSLKVVYP